MSTNDTSTRPDAGAGHVTLILDAPYNLRALEGEQPDDLADLIGKTVRPGRLATGMFAAMLAATRHGQYSDQIEVAEAVTLDSIYQQAEANWRSWRAQHPGVVLLHPEGHLDAGSPTDGAHAGLIDATRRAVPEDDAVLRCFAAEEQVWLTELDDPGQSPKHAVQSAVEQIVGIRLDRKVQSGELS